jgi:putative ABC transport system permease protein
MALSLLRIGFNHIKRHGLQSVLLVLGVAIGVAVIVSVDLANRSASQSFQLSTESLTGRATHRIVRGTSGLDENLYYQLKVKLGVEKIAPVIQDYVTVVQLNRRPMQLVGLDPFAEPPFRNYVAKLDDTASLPNLTALLTEQSSVIISQDVASSAGLGSGSTLTLEYGSRSIQVRIVGLLKPADDLSRLALDGMIITDISTAQEVLNRIGSLSHIDLILDTNTPFGRAEFDRIEQILPQDTHLEPPGMRNRSIQEINSAFRLNLLALSLLAILVGGFLIYNTVTFSVLQRRPILGILRALGVTRREIFGMIMFEALVLGAIGASLGLGLGIILGKGVVQLTAQTMNDLYFTLTVNNFAISPESLIKGFFIGISTSIIAAIMPAWEATRVPPAGVLLRSELESRISRSIPWVSLGGLILGGLGMVLLALPDRRLEIGFAAVFSMLFGAALLVPIITSFLMRLVELLPEKITGVIGRMAPRSIIRLQSRTGVAIAALMIAVSVIVSVDIMIGSFRSTVVGWLDDTLTADIFVTAPSTNLSSNEGLDPSISKEIAQLPGINRVATVRRTQIDTRNYGPTILVAVTRDIAEDRRFLWTEGSKYNVWQRLQKGEILISEPFSYRNRIPKKPGTAIELQTDKGPRRFEVAGVYYDYTSEKGVVLMSDAVYRKFWNDNQVSSVAVYVSRDQNVDSIIQQLQEGFAGRHNLKIQSNRSLRLSALRVFDRTFRITTALRFLVGIVAIIGVFSTLISLQLERTHEIGVLRATGMTVSQIWRMILLEAGLIGLTAGLIALPVGVLLALALVYVINLRSFGWTLEFVLRPEYLLEALLIAVFAAILAGIYPALRFGRTQVASALRME